jgi:hypothetical protein
MIIALADKALACYSQISQIRELQGLTCQEESSTVNGWGVALS